MLSRLGTWLLLCGLVNGALIKVSRDVDRQSGGSPTARKASHIPADMDPSAAMPLRAAAGQRRPDGVTNKPSSLATRYTPEQRADLTGDNAAWPDTPSKSGNSPFGGPKSLGRRDWTAPDFPTCGYDDCSDECAHKKTIMEIIEHHPETGLMHQMSQAICSTGSITNSFSRTFQMAVTFQQGNFVPTPKLLPVFEKIVPAPGFQVAHGDIRTTAYATTCDGEAACFQYFQPTFLVVHAKQYDGYFNRGGNLCKQEESGTVEMHWPMQNANCDSPSCGVAGAYGSCYMDNIDAAKLCPGREFNITKVNIKCPDKFAPILMPPADMATSFL